jgi:hypothetical protein
MILMAILLTTQAFCQPPEVLREEDSVLEVAHADFHAYENAWSVTFRSAPNAHAFDVLVFEICKPPCGADAGARAEDGGAELYPCRALARAFVQPGWRNEYIAGRANESARLCADLSDRGSPLQAQAARVLSGADGAPLARVRAPLTLVLFNEDELATGWASVVSEGEARPDILSVAVRVSYITALHNMFSMRRSVLRLRVRRPVRSALSFSVQNPCTALGFSAPEFGVVSLVNVSGRLVCAWFCREDYVKLPYNSAPPTRAQLNASTADYAQLAVKYECRKPPADWVSTVFGLTLESAMLATAGEYAQTLFDAVDRLAAAVRLSLVGAGEGIVLLSISSELYHPIPFVEWARRLRAAGCTDAAACAVEEISNPNYVYARRRLLAELLQNLRVDGVLISPPAALQEPGTPASEQPGTQADRVAEAQNLRVALASAIEENIELVAETDSSLVVRSVQDVDIEGVIVSQPKTAGDEEVEGTEQAATTALRDATMAGVALGASAIVLAVACAPHRVTRLLPRLRKPG